MLEKDMENLILLYPETFLEKGLTVISQQYQLLNGRRPDLVFKDRFDRYLIVEIQRGSLDDDHMVRMVDYYGAYKMEYPQRIVRLLFVANMVPAERKEFIARQGFECKELSMHYFKTIADKNNYVPVNDGPEIEKTNTSIIKRHSSKILAHTSGIDQLNYSSLPNRPLFTDSSLATIFDSFNDYLINYVLKDRPQVHIPQHSSWILAHKAGLHITLPGKESLNHDTRLYFQDQDNPRMPGQQNRFYQNLMKQPFTELKDINVYLLGNRANRVLKFVKKEADKTL